MYPALRYNASDMHDLALLVRDKYSGDATLVTEEDRKRLRSGEPLAYIIGWVPFLGLTLDLASRPLIPRPETEWWTEKLIGVLRTRFGDRPFSLLDIGAGSGCIGLSVAHAFPNAHVSLSDSEYRHIEIIKENARRNNIPQERIAVYTSDLFSDIPNAKWNVIVSNPPYIPQGRTLEQSVTSFEPNEALFAGTCGLDVISRLIAAASEFLVPQGELWIEVDMSHAERVSELCTHSGAKIAEVHSDPYERPRLVVAYW